MTEELENNRKQWFPKNTSLTKRHSLFLNYYSSTLCKGFVLENHINVFKKSEKYITTKDCVGMIRKNKKSKKIKENEQIRRIELSKY